MSANLDLVRSNMADLVRRLAEALGVSLVELAQLVEAEKGA
jgi:pyrroloquinoline quinone (PQQ) biosynthesis protein C